MTASSERSTYSFEDAGGGERLDRIVTAHLAESLQCSRSTVERWIEEGCVQVDGVVARKPGSRIDKAVTIVVTPPAPAASELSPYQMPLHILYEDDDLVVINKPAGLTMHPGAGNVAETLANAVVHHVGAAQRAVGESDRPGIVHRLDRDTTGLVVVAKSTPIHAALAQQFAERSVGRKYLALVFTTPRSNRAVQLADSGEVDAPIGRHPTKRTMMAVVESGRPAVTEWRVVERFQYGTLVACTLKTGRTHQIRVHMTHIGSPLVGDVTYGDSLNLPRQLREAATRFGRQALHAESLAFTHPRTGERLSFTASLPSDFELLLTAFKGQTDE
jgi:23S rRNA pseudouridine1911/1915/1917 synthase